MSRVYAVREDDGKRILVALECDRCDKTIAPHPDISMSGWVYVGQDNGIGTPKLSWDYCPDCARLDPE
jgi:ribosomal protein L44E